LFPATGNRSCKKKRKSSLTLAFTYLFVFLFLSLTTSAFRTLNHFTFCFDVGEKFWRVNSQIWNFEQPTVGKLSSFGHFFCVAGACRRLISCG